MNFFHGPVSVPLCFALSVSVLYCLSLGTCADKVQGCGMPCELGRDLLVVAAVAYLFRATVAKSAVSVTTQ